MFKLVKKLGKLVIALYNAEARKLNAKAKAEAVLAWALRGTRSTTPRPDSLNRLATLVKKEKEILDGLKKTESQTFDFGKAMFKDFKENIHKL